MAVIYAPGDTDERPWGRWEVLATGETYVTKRITVNPGGKLSLQLHHHREEHWVLVQGRALVTVGEDRRALGPSAYVFIPTEVAHRIENPGDEPVVFIEVQSGATLDEDDIVRLEDAYGR